VKFAARPDFQQLRGVLSKRLQTHLQGIDGAVGGKAERPPATPAGPLFAL
jgi:hypothetical protein